MPGQKLYFVLAAAALALAAACGGDDGQEATPARTVTPVDTFYATPDVPPINASPLAPRPIAEPSIDTSGWQELAHSSGHAVILFPAGWHALDDRLFSWDLGGATPLTAVSVEPGEMRVDLHVTPLRNFENRPPEATDIAIPAGVGWQTVYAYDPGQTGNVARIREAGVPLGDLAVFVTGYLSEAEPGGEQDQIFEAIVWSLQVSNA